MIGNGKMLAAVEGSKITKLYWPTVNNFQNMVESRLGLFDFDNNNAEWFDRWKVKQKYIGNSNILKTTAKNRGQITPNCLKLSLHVVNYSKEILGAWILI